MTTTLPVRGTSAKNLVLTSLAAILLATGITWAHCGACGTHAPAPPKDIVSTAAAAGQFKTLAAALTAADLVKPLQGKGPFTVFAPTDAAFARLPKGTLQTLLRPENKGLLTSILTYHVVPGRVKASRVIKIKAADTLNGQRVNVTVKGKKAYVDDAQVIKTDIAASNGVIHVIDKVILPSSKDIVATAVKAGSFKTLATALKTAGLVEALQGKGPFTVFAPTDKAFAKLPKDTVETLLKPANRGKLQAVLKYHVVAGRVFADRAVSAKQAKTLQGDSLRVSSSKEGVRINNARVISADVDAANGVIHVIDTVLLPPEKRQASHGPAAKRMLTHTIRNGSALYNAGYQKHCAAMYELTAEELLKMSPSPLSHDVREQLTRAMDRSRRTHCPDSRAWLMRHALNAAMAALD